LFIERKYIYYSYLSNIKFPKDTKQDHINRYTSADNERENLF
jgi:hypothetical protein